MKLSWSEAESKAQDRAEWRSIVGGLCSGRSWKAKKKKKITWVPVHILAHLTLNKQENKGKCRETIYQLQTPTSRIYSKGNTLKFWPKETHPCWIKRCRYLMANCGQMVRDNAMQSQWGAYRKPPLLFPMVRSTTPILSKWGSQMHPLWYVKFWMAISPQRVTWLTSCLVLGWGFQGRRIGWHYFQFDQIQDGNWLPSWKITARLQGMGKKWEWGSANR